MNAHKELELVFDNMWCNFWRE